GVGARSGTRVERRFGAGPADDERPRRATELAADLVIERVAAAAAYRASRLVPGGARRTGAELPAWSRAGPRPGGADRLPQPEMGCPRDPGPRPAPRLPSRRHPGNHGEAREGSHHLPEGTLPE